MIDTKAFRTLSCGLYLISTKDGDRAAGCVVNTLVQVTSKPPRVCVAINKDNATAQAVTRSGRYVATVLAQDATMELIGAFGFKSSLEIDKFADFVTAVDAAGVPYVAEQAVARFSVKVAETVDVGTHLLFIGDVEEAERLGEGDPMTYAYYHAVKGGKTPPKASSYEGDAADAPASHEDAAAADDEPAGPRVGWRCTICGYVVWQDELPDDFTCPICGVGKDMFERFVEE